MEAMASSFRGVFCTKRSTGVFETQSYLQDGAFGKKVNCFAKKPGVFWQGSKYVAFRESLWKCN